MPIKQKFLPLLLPFLLSACSNFDSSKVEIHRLDHAVSEATALTADERNALDALHEVMPYEASPSVMRFQADVDSLLPSLDGVETQLGEAAAKMSHFGKLYAIVSLYNQSVITVGNDYVFIGLNHYLGEDYPGYSGHFPDYMLHRKTLAQLPADVVRAIIERDCPAQFSTDATLLNRMLRDGAVNYAVSCYLHTDNPIGFSSEQLQWCKENEARIWRQMMEAQLLFSTDPTVADRLLNPATASLPINANAPGETARFTALQIVRAYVEQHPDAEISTLLSPDFYNSNQSLIDSQYAPNGN